MYMSIHFDTKNVSHQSTAKKFYKNKTNLLAA